MKSKSTMIKPPETAEEYRNRLGLGKPFWNTTNQKDEVKIDWIKPVTGHISKGLDE